MNKEELHIELAKVNIEDNPPLNVSQDVFISIYGNDDKRNMKGIETGRADVLANVYDLNVTFEDSSYTFTRKP